MSEKPKTKAVTKTPGCDCLKKVQVEARKQGIQFTSYPMIDFKKGKMGMSGPHLMIEKSEGFPKNKKLPTVECAFCPFCGKAKSN